MTDYKLLDSQLKLTLADETDALGRERLSDFFCGYFHVPGSSGSSSVAAALTASRPQSSSRGAVTVGGDGAATRDAASHRSRASRRCDLPRPATGNDLEDCISHRAGIL